MPFYPHNIGGWLSTPAVGVLRGIFIFNLFYYSYSCGILLEVLLGALVGASWALPSLYRSRSGLAPAGFTTVPCVYLLTPFRVSYYEFSPNCPR